MKLWLFGLFAVSAQGITVRTQTSEEPEKTAEPEKKTPSAEASALPAICAACDDKTNPLCPFSTDELKAELERRAKQEEAKKKGECDKPKEEAPEPAAPAPAPVNTTSSTTTSTPPPPDNFADELQDQANANFEEMDKNKDGCIEKDELTHQMKVAVEVAKKRKQYYWKNEKAQADGANITNKLEKRHTKADKDGDGCLDKEEFENVKIGITKCKKQFRLMDANGDKKISKPEASQYVNDHMPHANLSYEKFNEIWKAADANGNNFLDLKEFCEAGPKYDGDGDEA